MELGVHVLPSDAKLHSVLSLTELTWQTESGKPVNMGGWEGVC